ncbi:MAG: hypothetical protein HOC48_01870 [Nitrosomonadales bacterium]|nr:hypothetical protein [Nitrosomonadales bacterium]
MSKIFSFLKNDFTKLYMKNVLEHKAVNKVIAFCDDNNLNIIYTGMFSEVNNGKGIADDLELYLVSYLTEKHNVKGFARASAYVLEDQTTFIGFDIKTVDNEIWSQQNIFSVDEEGKVTGVEGSYKESSDKSVICPLVTSYFEKINLPEDTQQYLDNLYQQIKPNLQIIKMN